MNEQPKMECPNCANPPHEGPCRRKRVAEPIAPLSDERVRELTQLTRNGPEVVALAQEAMRSRKRAAIRAEDEPERAAWEALVAYAQTGGKDSPLVIYQITTHYLRMQVACEKAEEDAERSRERIASLEAENADFRRACPDCGGSCVEYSGVCHCGQSVDEHSLYDNHCITEMTRPCEMCNGKQRATLRDIALALGLPADAEPDAVLAAVKDAAKDHEQLTVVAIEARDHIYTRQDIDRVREMAACALKAVNEGAKR